MMEALRETGRCYAAPFGDGRQSQEPADARKGEKTFSPGAFKRNQHLDPSPGKLTLDFQPLEPKREHTGVELTTAFMVVCYAATGNECNF